MMEVEEILKSNKYVLRTFGFWPSENLYNYTLSRLKGYIAVFFIFLGTSFVIFAQITLVGDTIVFIDGEMIYSASLSVSRAIDTNCWKSDNIRANKDSIFIVQRAQKPMQIAVGTFGVINLKFFCDSMYNAISYAMILKTMKTIIIDKSSCSIKFLKQTTNTDREIDDSPKRKQETKSKFLLLSTTANSQQQFGK
ncbi:hypothetical protein HZH68_014157 [Vespula germanica]|uniref:Uncharacterized protein n=1 Tax=Vespula germanica TaxID=30212 RepID=A0A834MU36_VESGE|nr:hypothetical protein HZH68_014157 [Vespula germanica]